MVNTRGIVRLGVLAVGLGIGAAVAHSPVALADTDLQISFDGMDLFPTTGNEATATTVAGEYGLAIAFGDGAEAYAEGGTGDYALASGTNALAGAGSVTASAGNNYDSAYDIGNNSDIGDGAYAGAGSLNGGTDSATSSHDTAIDIGNNTGAGGDGGNSGAFAGDAHLVGFSDPGMAGNGDTAYTFGNTSGVDDGSEAIDGNNNYASMSGNDNSSADGPQAGFGNGNTAIADTSYTQGDDGPGAEDGNNNYAYVYGPDNSTASADGNDNIAYVDDPYGTAGNPDSAIAGDDLYNNNLAEVLFTHGNALADGPNYAYDIISPLGPEAGTAAATGGTSFLSELLSLF
jgi:hypothetical protein